MGKEVGINLEPVVDELVLIKRLLVLQLLRDGASLAEIDATLDIHRDLSTIKGDIEGVQLHLCELTDLIRFLVEPLIEDALIDIFDGPQQIRAYELSDGKRSTREIGSLIGVDQKTISTWWRKWKDEFGIVEQTGNRGQYQRQFSFIELMVRHSQSRAFPTSYKRPDDTI